MMTTVERIDTEAANRAGSAARRLGVESYPKIGFNKMIVVAPDTYVSSQVLGEATGLDPDRISIGLGVNKARLPTYSQSNATLAANAVYKFIKSVAANDDDRERFFAEPINAIYYATESNDDFSRPEAVVALSMATSRLLNENETLYRPYIDMLRHVELKQVTFACAGAGLSLSNALESIYAAYTFGRKESAIILSTDTAVYDNARSPNAESTQGSSATLVWVTRNPKLLEIEYSKGYGKFTLSYPDFTKFGNRNPLTYGTFSEIGFVYAAAEAVEELENKYGNGKGLIAVINAFISHVPFPKQAIYFASFLFEHYLKTYDKELFDELQAKPDIGPSPIDSRKFTDLVREKLVAFRGKDSDIVDYITKDKEIKAYWDWLKKLREMPDSSDATEKRHVRWLEFDKFIKRLNIDSALILPAEVGNSYTGSTHVALASELLYGNGTDFVVAYYGSGLITEAFYAKLAAKSRKEIENGIIVTFGSHDIPLDASQYIAVHENLLRGDADRTMNAGKIDLINKDMLMLLRDRKEKVLPEGFYLRNRNVDGTWNAAYSDGTNIVDILPRY